MTRGHWLSALALLGLACSTPLPSAEPLGEGPLAKAEAAERAKAEAEAEARGSAPASASASAQGPNKPAAPTSSSVASAADAGAAVDAGSASSSASDAGSTSTAVADVAGEYLGSDVSTITIGGNTQEQKDDKARTRVEVPGPAEVSFTFVASNTGTDICTLKAKLSGKTATLTPGQDCWSEGDGTSGTLTRGTATFTDKRLVIDADFDLSLSGGISGSLVYHFDGTKK